MIAYQKRGKNLFSQYSSFLALKIFEALEKI